MKEKECVKISKGTCKKISICGSGCEFYEPQKEEPMPYGYTMCGGQIRDKLPHGARYYI